MQKDAFWITAKDLLRYKKTLAMALVGAVLYTGGMGAGLSLVVPLVNLFMDGTSPQEYYKEVDATTQRRLEDLADAGLISPQEAERLTQGLPDAIPAEAFDPNPLRLTLRNTADKSAKYIPDGVESWIDAKLYALADILPDDPWATLAAILWFMSIVSLMACLGRYMHQYMTITVCNHLALDYRNRILARLLAMPLVRRTNTQDAADSATRVIVDSQQLARGHEAILGKVFVEALKGIVAFTIALIISVQLTMVFLVSAVIIGVALNRIGKRIRKASKKSLEQQGELLKHMTAVMQALSVVKSFNAIGYERRRFKRLNRVLYTQQMKMRKARAWTSPITEFVGYLGISSAGILATYWVFHGDFEKQTVIGVLAGLGIAASSIKPISGIHNQIKEAEAAAARILEALNVEEEPLDIKSRRSLPLIKPHTESITFEEIGFHYPTQPDEPALCGINLTVKHGQTVAVVGTNGAGKTTLLTMLPRLFVPTAGRVLIDGVDIQTVNLRSLREAIGVVTQQAVVFEGKLRDNLTYGQSAIPQERIEQAAKIACAHDFIQALPGAYDYELSEGGQGLSGGQRQRICLARAILKDPSILILDEATSQIDAESEAQIAQAMAAIRQGRTTFIIAHRLSTVVDSDMIVVMDQGTIIATGTHHELLESCALYQSLTQHQLVQA